MTDDRVNILLVDDQPNNLLALESILGDMGESLITASSGTQALRHLLHHDFAVILLDVQMPDLDGFETASLIRQRDRSRDTPIIFLTALSRSESNVFRGYELGAVDYIFKPFHPEILRSKVSVFVELFKQREAFKRQAQELARLIETERADSQRRRRRSLRRRTARQDDLRQSRGRAHDRTQPRRSRRRGHPHARASDIPWRHDLRCDALPSSRGRPRRSDLRRSAGNLFPRRRHELSRRVLRVADASRRRRAPRIRDHVSATSPKNAPRPRPPRSSGATAKPKRRTTPRTTSWRRSPTSCARR